jgi:hypothetical protein
LEAQHQKELGSLREEVARLTSLLEQALGSKFREAKFTAQPELLLANPQNLEEKKVLFQSQQTTYSQIAQPAYLIKRSSTIDFTMKESEKDKMVR